MLLILSKIYGFISRTNLFLHQKNFLKSYEVKTEVISIGNIIVGGSGKTPLTIYLCNLLTKNGFRIAVVGRGYGRNNSKNVILKQNQSNLELNAENIGDEMLEIYQNTQADVYVGSKKFEMVIIAETESPKYDYIIIDDGFQHFKIKKNIEIVILDNNTIKEKYLLPKGRLRESYQSLNRADIIVTRNIELDVLSKFFLKNKLELDNKISIFNFYYEIKNIINYHSLKSHNIGEFLDINQNIYSLITAIANPQRFLDNMIELGFQIQQNSIFKDHHNYKLNEIENIIKNNDGSVQFITTEKDFVKLKPLLIQLDKINNNNIIERFYFVKLELKEKNNKNNLIQTILNKNYNS